MDDPPLSYAFLAAALRNPNVAAALGEAFGPVVEDALRRALPEVVRRAQIPPYLTRRQVLAITGWSDRRLSYLQAERRIPFIKRGRTVLFRAADVERYLMEGFVLPRDWRKEEWDCDTESQ